MNIARTLSLLFSTAAVSVLLTACPKSINPSDPVGAPGPLPISTNVSYLTVPFTVQLKDIEAIANRAAPTHFEDTWHNTITIDVPDGIRFHGFHSSVHTHQIHKEVPPHVDFQVSRDAIHLAGAGDRVSINAPAHAHAREEPGGLTASADGNVAGSTTLTVTPDFNFAPSVDVSVHFDRAVINLPLLNRINLSGFANSKANDAVNSIRPTLAQEVSRAVDLRKKAQGAWDKLPGSVLVPGTSDIWARFTPKAVMLEGPHAANDIVTGVVGLQTGVEILFQPNLPASPPHISLPNLAPVPSDRNFHIFLPVKAQIDELNKQLSTLIKGANNGTIDLGQGYVISLEGVALFPHGNQLFLKVCFAIEKGAFLDKISGTLIFVATPKLDAAKQNLSFQNIDFTADTKSTLKGAAVEAATVILKPLIIDELQKRLVADLAPQLAKAKSEANASVGQLKLPPPLQLKFNLEQLETQDLAVYGDTLYVDFSASGTTEVTF